MYAQRLRTVWLLWIELSVGSAKQSSSPTITKEYWYAHNVVITRERAAVRKARRLASIPELLRLKPRTASELAERLGVPVRTIQRDLEALREMGEGIEEVRRGVYLIPQVRSHLSAVEALAIHAAFRLLYHHSPTRSPFYLSALEKLSALLPEPARTAAFRSAEDLRGRPRDDRTLELAARAWFEGRVLAFEYRSPGGSGLWRNKEVEVYFIEVSRENLAPYAIGFERTFHRRILTWKLSRMRHARLLDDAYEVPPTFDPRQYLSNAWGVMGASGGPLATVRLRFFPEAAYRLEEGGYVNLTVEEKQADGSLLVSLPAGTDSQGFPLEILPWVQSWGPRVEVLEPEALRRRWLEEAQQVMSLSESSGG